MNSFQVESIRAIVVQFFVSLPIGEVSLVLEWSSRNTPPNVSFNWCFFFSCSLNVHHNALVVLHLLLTCSVSSSCSWHCGCIHFSSYSYSHAPQLVMQTHQPHHWECFFFLYFRGLRHNLIKIDLLYQKHVHKNLLLCVLNWKISYVWYMFEDTLISDMSLFINGISCDYAAMHIDSSHVTVELHRV